MYKHVCATPQKHSSSTFSRQKTRSYARYATVALSSYNASVASDRCAVCKIVAKQEEEHTSKQQDKKL